MSIYLNKRLYSIVFTIFISFFAVASLKTMAEVEKTSTQLKAETSQKMRESFPHLKNIELEESSIPGVFQFWIGNNLNYVSFVNGHLFLGELYDTNRKVFLAEEAKQQKTKEIIDDVKDSDTIIFANKKAQRTINVFTDVDCYYCRELHKEINQLTDAGVKVRYIAYPAYKRDFKKHVSVWCSKDQQEAMTQAKTGKAVPEQVCEAPVQETFQLGVSLGFRGTPQIVYDDGTIVGGYRPAKQIIQELGLGK